MKALVVYDSKYGHAEMIARAIADAIGGRVLLVGELKPADMKDLDLLVIGSPTHGGWYTEGIKQTLGSLEIRSGVHIAVFDTRTRRSLFGFAAPRMASSLEKMAGACLCRRKDLLCWVSKARSGKVSWRALPGGQRRSHENPRRLTMVES